MVQKVITKSDFDNILNNYAGRQIILVQTTKSYDNITGEETLINNNGIFIKAYFMKTGQNWDFEKAGFIEKGDAVMLSKYEDSVQKDDKIVIDENDMYYVKERYDVPGIFDPTGTTDNETEYIYTACNLFLQNAN